MLCSRKKKLVLLDRHTSRLSFTLFCWPASAWEIFTPRTINPKSCTHTVPCPHYPCMYVHLMQEKKGSSVSFLPRYFPVRYFPTFCAVQKLGCREKSPGADLIPHQRFWWFRDDDDHIIIITIPDTHWWWAINSSFSFYSFHYKALHGISPRLRTLSLIFSLFLYYFLYFHTWREPPFICDR